MTEKQTGELYKKIEKESYHLDTGRTSLGKYLHQDEIKELLDLAKGDLFELINRVNKASDNNGNAYAYAYQVLEERIRKWFGAP